jgi:hypothetical protein
MRHAAPAGPTPSRRTSATHSRSSLIRVLDNQRQRGRLVETELLAPDIAAQARCAAMQQTPRL